MKLTVSVMCLGLVGLVGGYAGVFGTSITGMFRGEPTGARSHVGGRSSRSHDARATLPAVFAEELMKARESGSREVYDNSALDGAYAFSSSGATSSYIYSLTTSWQTVCETRMGLWRFDGRGDFTQTKVAHGSVRLPNDGTSEQVMGTYLVDPSGAVRFQVSNGALLSGILTANGDGFVFEGITRIGDATTGTSVESGYARRLN